MASSADALKIPGIISTGGPAADNKITTGNVKRDISNLGQFSLDVSGESRGKASQALDPSLKFLTQILSGNKNLMAEATAPENATILSQYDTARRQIRELAPRGGNKGQAIAESYFQQAGDMTKVIENLRGNAAQTLASIGLDLSKLSDEELAMGIQQFQTLLSGAISQSNSTKELWGSIGGGVGTLLGAVFGKH